MCVYERQRWVKERKGENVELFYGMVSVGMKAVVRDLLSLFVEQQSISMHMAVLICPTCLDTYTHARTHN